MTTIIEVKPPNRAGYDMASFADLTTNTCLIIRWNDAGTAIEIVFDGTLTADQIDAVATRWESRNPNEEAMRRQAKGAIVNLKPYLDLAAPTNAQTVAQVKAATRTIIGLARMQLGQLDQVD